MGAGVQQNARVGGDPGRRLRLLGADGPVGSAWGGQAADGLQQLCVLTPRRALHASDRTAGGLCCAAGNGFHNKINSSLFLDTARFMKSSGLLDAGYTYVTLGGIGYANGSTWPDGQQGWGPAGPGNITRNASGFLVVDPAMCASPGGTRGCGR